MPPELLGEMSIHHRLMDNGSMRLLKLLLIGAMMLVASELCGQTTFEVASVKQGVPFPGRPDLYIMRGGGIETGDPGQFTATRIPLLNLILWAYGRIPSQVASSRSLEMDRYNIVAKVLPGTTAAQVRVMMQNLLAERIGLVVHHEVQRGPIYELVVAKSGLKMKSAEPVPSGADDSSSAGLPAGVSLGKDDSLQLAPGRHNWILERIDASTMRIAARVLDLPDLIRIMERQVGRTVIDKTGLSGKYDLDFTFTRAAGPAADPDVGLAATGAASDPSSDFFSAMQSQLGLKLVPRKGPVDVLVVDKWNKVPAGN